DCVVPRGKPREVTNNFDFAHLGHIAEIFSLGSAEQFGRIHLRDIERRQLPRGLPSRRLLEDQPFVLIHVARSLWCLVLHRVTSAISASVLAGRADRSLSATNPTAVSIALRVVSSVQHHRAAFPNSG